MSTDETLYCRALRILTDGRRHCLSAMQWASEFTESRQQANVKELERAGFTLSEIRLGVAEVVR